MLAKYLDSINKRGVILASGSSGRASICKLIGLLPEIVASGFPEDENWRKFESPQEYALFNARNKSSMISSEKVVISADTVIALDGEVFEKPVDREDFVRMMKRFSGRTHLLITALVVRGTVNQEIIETTELEVDELDDDTINAIAETPEEWKYHSGGYSIEAKYGSTIFKKINGSYYNIMGLPANTLAKMLIHEHRSYENSKLLVN